MRGKGLEKISKQFPEECGPTPFGDGSTIAHGSVTDRGPGATGGSHHVWTRTFPNGFQQIYWEDWSEYGNKVCSGYEERQPGARPKAGLEVVDGAIKTPFIAGVKVPDFAKAQTGRDFESGAQFEAYLKEKNLTVPMAGEGRSRMPTKVAPVIQNVDDENVSIRVEAVRVSDNPIRGG